MDVLVGRERLLDILYCGDRYAVELLVIGTIEGIEMSIFWRN